jgi:SAM-dependent methyltransferase
MKMIRMDPPGSHCHYAAVLDYIDQLPARQFLEVGVGDGGLSRRLLARGMRGIGLDFSAAAIALARERMNSEIGAGRYALFQQDLLDFNPELPIEVDLALSMMVMEHVADDIGFIRALSRHVKPGGHLLLSVPGRRDRWSVEDETVGHLRRYDRTDLRTVMTAAGLDVLSIRSVSVPIANLLHGVGNLLVKRHAKLAPPTQRGQTEASGIREIPFKTIFPLWCRAILNPITLAPLIALQRLFYDSDLGLEIMGLARVPSRPV